MLESLKSFSSHSVALGLIVVAALVESFGDIALRKWALSQQHSIPFVGLITYSCAALIWAFALKHQALSKSIVMVTIFNMIFVILIGVLYFKEDVTFANKIGILLGLVSIALLDA